MNVKMHPRKSFLTTNNEIVVTGLKNQSKSNTKKEILTTLTTDKGEHEEIKTTPSIPKQQTIEDKKSTWDKEEQKDFILDPNSVETAEPLATNTKPDTEKAPNDTKPKESLTWEEVVKNQTKELNNPPETTSAEIPLDVKPDQTETPWGENATTDIQTSTNISPLDANPVADTPQEEIKKEKTLVEIPTWGEEQKTVPSTETETISQEEVLDVKPTPEDNAWKVEEEELLVPPTPPTPSSPSAISANEIEAETPTEAATTKTWEEVAETAQVSEPENVQTPPQYIEEIPETEPIVEVYDTEKEIPKKRISLRSLLFSIDINVLVFYIFTFIITVAVIVLNLDFESKINIKDTSEIPVTEQPLLIKAPLKIIHIPSLNKGSILTAIGNLRNNTQTEISQLALALNKEKTSLVPANILLPIIDIDLEPNFASSITHLYFGDVRNEQPFIVMKVADHDISKGGMFIWEKSMYNDLRPIFKNYVNPTEDTAVTAKFYDATLNDTDLRVLEDGDGNEKLIYGFVNPDTIIITADSIIMSELIQLK